MRETVINELEHERNLQDKKWGTAFDDKHTPYNWAAFIAQYATNHLIGDPAAMSESVFRDDLVKVAALAIAAIGSIDRRTS